MLVLWVQKLHLRLKLLKAWRTKSIICQPGDAVKALRGDSGTNFIK